MMGKTSHKICGRGKDLQQMKWTKRAAASLVSLLLLSTLVQAGGVYKAPPREERPVPDFRLASPVEAEESGKLPELTVVSPELARPEEPEGPRFPAAEDWQLLLVNPWNEIPEDYTVELKTLPDGMKVDERAYESLTAMLEACREAGLRPKICSTGPRPSRPISTTTKSPACATPATAAPPLRRRQAAGWPVPAPASTNWVLRWTSCPSPIRP